MPHFGQVRPSFLEIFFAQAGQKSSPEKRSRPQEMQEKFSGYSHSAARMSVPSRPLKVLGLPLQLLPGARKLLQKAG